VGQHKGAPLGYNPAHSQILIYPDDSNLISETLMERGKNYKPSLIIEDKAIKGY
jgi:hypothetical protein